MHLSKAVLFAAMTTLAVGPVAAQERADADPSSAVGQRVGERVTPDVVYGHKFGMALTFDVFHPEPRRDRGLGVLFIVSGGWYSRWVPPQEIEPRFRPLLDRGFTVFAVRHGSSPKFTISDAVEDVRRSVRFIRLNSQRFGVDPDRLGVFGMSAGGHLALMLGLASDPGAPDAEDPVNRVSDRVAAVAAFVPPTDLTIMVRGAPERLPEYDNFPALDLDLEAARKASPIRHVSEDDPPILLIAGVEDRLVPIEHSRRLHEALKSAGVTTELVEFTESGHGLRDEDLVEAYAALVTWFDRHLSKDEAR